MSVVCKLIGHRPVIEDHQVVEAFGERMIIWRFFCIRCRLTTFAATLEDRP